MSSLDDAIAILRCFSLKEAELSQAEITRRLGRPKSTISRVLRTMRENSMLHFDRRTRHYSPGVSLSELGQIFRARRNFLDLVHSHLKVACDQCGHTGYITAFAGPDLVVVQMVLGSSPLAISSAPGLRVPAHATSNGRAMLAMLSNEGWQRRLPEPMAYVSPKTPSTHDELSDALEKIRTTGVSSSSDELHQGLSSQGIASSDPDTREIFGIAISYPTYLKTKELRTELIDLLNELKEELVRHSGADVTVAPKI